MNVVEARDMDREAELWLDLLCIFHVFKLQSEKNHNDNDDNDTILFCVDVGFNSNNDQMNQEHSHLNAVSWTVYKVLKAFCLAF